LREQIEEEIDAAFRAAAVDVLAAALGRSSRPGHWSRRVRASCSTASCARSRRRGITPEAYFAATGASETGADRPAPRGGVAVGRP